jgi:hypothetical protein
MSWTLRDIAVRILPTYRRKLLEGNLIYKAVPAPNDEHMRVLYTVWTTFVDTSGMLEPDCAYCMADILNNFKQLQPVLVELEQEAALLEL